LKIGYNRFCANRCRLVLARLPTVVGRRSAGQAARKPNLTDDQKREAIRRRDRDGEPVREIARSYSVNCSMISRITVEH
jgi:hypothetical protein